MELVQQLKEDGIAKGLCLDWQNKLKDGLSVQRLIKLYTRGIDFCIKNDYPTLEFIRKNFKGKCEPYGVYIDERGLRLRDKEYVVLHGDCTGGVLKYGGFSVARVVARHNSEIQVKVSGNAHLTIDLFDDAKLELVVAGYNARVLVYRYGNSSAECTGDGVKVVIKNKNSY